MSQSDIIIEWWTLEERLRAPNYVLPDPIVTVEWQVFIDSANPYFWQPISLSAVGLRASSLSLLPSRVRLPKAKWEIVRDPEAVIQKDWRIRINCMMESIRLGEQIGEEASKKGLYIRPYIASIMSASIQPSQKPQNDDEHARLMRFFFGGNK